MKAIVMAGGEGRRLRPISAKRPKPMVELVDRPVLGHILALLRGNGVKEVCLTLRHMPEAVVDYVGGGEKFGLKAQYKIEGEALGTAGGVRNCADFIGSEDFLVISGDCICDFDLKALVAFHKERKAKATIALFSHSEPLEYGLVVTGEDGRVRCFLEKPPWERVLTDQVNTGIYVLSPSVLEDIPQGGPYDFGRDLFPRLLAAGAPIYGFAAKGYWCDIGSGGAYLKCCLDVLRGDVRLGLEAPLAAEGVWCAGRVAEGAQVLPPVYIGRGAEVERGARVGPYAVIGADSRIQAGAQVSGSAVYAARIGEGAVVAGAVVLHGSAVGRGARLSEGAVVGEDCTVGERAILSSAARMWPGSRVGPGEAAAGAVLAEGCRGGVKFTRPGVIEIGEETPLPVEEFMKLGASSGDFGRVGVGWSGGESARVLSEAFACGVCATGGDVIRFDGGFLACASYAALVFDLPLTVFFSEDGAVSASFFGKGGLAIGREAERKLEASLSEPLLAHRVPPGRLSSVAGVLEAYVASAARNALSSIGGARGMKVAVAGRGDENRALRRAIEMAGGVPVSECEGVVKLSVSDGGTALSAVDEEGRVVPGGLLGAILAHIEFSCGAKKLAVMHDAPAAIEKIAERFGAVVLRVGRDGEEAEELFSRQMTMRDGIYGGALLCAWLGSRGEKLSELQKSLPKFSALAREVPVRAGRGAAMRLMHGACAGMARDFTSGLSVDTGRGLVHISPLREQSALKIRAESFSEEAAAELVSEFERLARENDTA